MKDNFNIHEWEAGLNDQFNSFEPVLPEGVWNHINTHLESINPDLSFDQHIRDGFENLELSTTPDVWSGVKNALVSKPGFFEANWGKIAIGASIVAIISMYGVSDLATPDHSTTPNKSSDEVTQQILSVEIEGDDIQGIPDIVEGSIKSRDILKTSEPEIDKNQKNTSSATVNTTTPAKKTAVKIPQDTDTELPASTNAGSPQGSNHDANGQPPIIYNGITTFHPYVFGGDDTVICLGQALIFNPPKGCVKTEVFVNAKLKSTFHASEKINWTFEEPGIYLLELKLHSQDGAKSYYKKVLVNQLPKVSIYGGETEAGRYAFASEVSNTEKITWFSDYVIVSTNHKFEKKYFDERRKEHRVVCVVSSGQGCKDSVVKTFTNVSTWKEPIIADAITPGNDGINDFLEIKIEGHTYFEVAVYNANKELVFSSNDPAHKWNGRMHNEGEICAQGTYLCVLRYSIAGGDIKPKTQLVDLILERKD